MAARALDALRPHASPLYRVGQQSEGEGSASGRESGTGRLPDSRPGVGPLGGVEALLIEASGRGAPGALVLACDLPLVGPEVVGLLARAAAAEPARGVVVAGPSPDDVQPLCGYWPVAGLGRLRELLDGGTRSAREAAERLEVRVLGPAEIGRVADPARALLNVNTPAGRERAEALLEPA